MGRMRHSLLLGKWKEMFFWLPVEELIQSRQKEYYDALGAADAQADFPQELSESCSGAETDWAHDS